MCKSTQPKGFKAIKAWQKSDDLAVKVYEVTQGFPRHQLYTLTNQMQRAAISVPANIAEGSGRSTVADYLRFLYIARGSLFELEYYLHLARRLGYLDEEAYKAVASLQSETAKILAGFIKAKQRQLRTP